MLEKARQTDGSGKKELIKGGRQRVYTSVRIWGSTFLNEAESEDFERSIFMNLFYPFKEEILS